MLMAIVRESAAEEENERAAAAAAAASGTLNTAQARGADAMAVDVSEQDTEAGPATRLADALGAPAPAPRDGLTPSDVSAAAAPASDTSVTATIKGVQLAKRALVAVSSLARHSAAVSRMLVTLRVPPSVAAAVAPRPDPKGKARPVDENANMAGQPSVAEVLLYTVSDVCKVSPGRVT